MLPQFWNALKHRRSKDFEGNQLNNLLPTSRSGRSGQPDGIHPGFARVLKDPGVNQIQDVQLTFAGAIALVQLKFDPATQRKKTLDDFTVPAASQISKFNRYVTKFCSDGLVGAPRDPRRPLCPALTCPGLCRFLAL